jgi:hypothetical protein
VVIIKLKRENNHYSLCKVIPNKAYLLAFFLTDDVGRRISGWVGDFESDDDHAGSGNATQYLKEDGMVTFTPEWVWDDDESIAKGDYFQIPAPLLVDLLYQWGALLQSPPVYIVITIDDYCVKAIGSNDDIEVDWGSIKTAESKFKN